MKVELVPGKLSVSFVEHTIERAPGRFWSFVSEGLAAHEQKEIVFTLKANATEKEVPQGIFQYFSAVYHYASQGKLVHAGGFTAFGPKGFLVSHWRGVIYAEAHPLPGVTMPSDALTAIAIYEDELSIAQNINAYRILGRLGKRYSYFPFTPWSDRERPSVARPGDEESLFGKAPSIYMQGSSLVMENQSLTLNLSKKEAQRLAEEAKRIPPGAAFSLVTQPHSTIRAWSVWEPGQQNPFAITGPEQDASQIAGCSLLIVLGQGQDTANLFEDGFSLLMRDETWRRLVAALQAPTDCTLQTSNLTLHLSIIREDFYNPVDGRTYHAPGGWKRAGDGDGSAEITLLNSEDELRRAVEIKELATYINQLMKVLESSSLSRGAAVKTYLHVELSPGVSPRIMGRCEPVVDIPDALMRDVLSVEPPAVRGTIAFQLMRLLGLNG